MSIMGKTSGRTQKYVRLFSRGSLFSGEMAGGRISPTEDKRTLNGPL